MKTLYLRSENEWSEYSQFVESLVGKYCYRKICDVGGGANPVLSMQFVNENQLDCTVLDISREELEKAAETYKKLVQDIEARDFIPTDSYDFVITKMIAEHLRDGRLFHRNVFAILRQGGMAIHYFPTLYTPPFLVNKFVPEWLSSFLLDVFLPRDRHQLGKFPAYYSWCYGPTPAMLSMLQEVGFEIVEYRSFFGNRYYERIPILRDLHKTYTRYLVKHPNPYLTSFAQVILRRP